MIKLKNLIRESYLHGRPEDEYQEIHDEMQQEFHSGQKYQTWNLIPAKDILLIWATFAKYGRVDENKLDKVWNIVKENVIKIVINTDVWQGSNPEFFGKDNFDDVTQEEWDRHCLFVADRSDAKYVRNYGEVEGNARFSDCYNSLFKLLERCYSAKSAEELLMGIDSILNFVHGLGNMAKWFVEGGTDTLNKIRDYEAKGIALRGKLSESFFKSFEIDYGRGIHYVEVFKNPTSRELKECKPHYEIGAILTDNDIFVWNREKAYHRHVMTQLGLKNDLPLMLYPDNSNINRMDIMVTDASIGTQWDQNSNTAEFIKSHPFFKGKLIDSISYWNEDVIGPWDNISESSNSKKNPRLGLCYELSGRYVSNHTNAILVHGRLTNPFGKGHTELDHGWVEEGNEIFDPVMDKVWPKEVYESLFKTKVYKKYSFEEVLKMILRHKNWGPWD